MVLERVSVIGLEFEAAQAEMLVVTFASMILFLLVVARMAGLVRQEERVVARERAGLATAFDVERAPAGGGWKPKRLSTVRPWGLPSRSRNAPASTGCLVAAQVKRTVKAIR